MNPMFRAALWLSPLLGLSACSSLSPQRGYQDSADLVAARINAAPQWPATNFDPAKLDGQVFSADAAVQHALLHHPQILAQFSRLGLARADLEQARRLANPRLGLQRLSTPEGRQITRSISMGLTELLLLPSAKRLASVDLQRVEQQVAAVILERATAVETAWVRAVSARQQARMAKLVAQAADASAALAQRFFDAGTIHRLQLELELAAAAQARIAAVRAGAGELKARSTLADLLALPMDANWSVPVELAAPRALPEGLDAQALVKLALEQRLDLSAAQLSVRQHEDRLGITRRWRWLGDIEAGYESESEADGARSRGPELALSIPLFDQGQATTARADARLQRARAELDELTLAVHNHTQLALAQLKTQLQIASQYRELLLPRREAVVERSQERVNYMLIGVFELIEARQDQYRAYAEYLQAVRDYWVARVQLRQQVGGRLPDDGEAAQGADDMIGVDAMLPPAGSSAHEHQGHGAQPAADPHEGHDAHQGHKAPAADAHEDHDAHEGHLPPAAKEPSPEHRHHHPDADADAAADTGSGEQP